MKILQDPATLRSDHAEAAYRESQEPKARCFDETQAHPKNKPLSRLVFLGGRAKSQQNLEAASHRETRQAHYQSILRVLQVCMVAQSRTSHTRMTCARCIWTMPLLRGTKRGSNGIHALDIFRTASCGVGPRAQRPTDWSASRRKRRE